MRTNPDPPHPPVPPEPLWRRSSFCDTGSCVRVLFRPRDDKVLVSDSKNPDGGTIAHDRYSWSLILDAINYGGGTNEVVDRLAEVHRYGDTFTWSHDEVFLGFDRDEMDAFIAGARAGEFDLPGVGDA